MILSLALGRLNHHGREVGPNSVCNLNPFAIQYRNQVQEIHTASATEFQDTNATFPGSLRQEGECFNVNRLIIMIEKVIDSEACRGPGVFQDLILRRDRKSTRLNSSH